MGTHRQKPTGDNARVRSVFRRRANSRDHPAPVGLFGSDSEKHAPPTHARSGRTLEAGQLPTHNSEARVGKRGTVYNHAGHKVSKGIKPDGESGRKGISPLMFVSICFKSTCTASMLTNLLWPFTIAAMVLHFAFTGNHLWVFITSYLGMVPAANLIGFSGQELARKLPTVWGVLLETTFGSIVELILFMVLITSPGNTNVPVIQAAILGSILANLLLCLGLCFLIGGIFHPQQTFHEAISEVGSNLMFVAGVGLVIPTIYYSSLIGTHDAAMVEAEALNISHATAIVLLFSFVVYMYFQARSHHGLYEDILRGDELQDHDRWMDLKKEKLTLTEALIAVVIGITFVTFMAIFLVQQIDYLRDERGLSDSFIGLILIPVVEKAAEHITAMDEAYDNQMNFALAHVLGASIQTALLNTPLVVLIGWGLHKEMSLNFELFDAVLLILAILVISNFLRDEKSDYLEGSLSVFVYILIAISAWYYPNPPSSHEPSSSGAVHERAVNVLADRLLNRG